MYFENKHVCHHALPCLLVTNYHRNRVCPLNRGLPAAWKTLSLWVICNRRSMMGSEYDPLLYHKQHSQCLVLYRKKSLVMSR